MAWKDPQWGPPQEGWNPKYVCPVQPAVPVMAGASLQDGWWSLKIYSTVSFFLVPDWLEDQTSTSKMSAIMTWWLVTMKHGNYWQRIAQAGGRPSKREHPELNRRRRSCGRREDTDVSRWQQSHQHHHKTQHLPAAIATVSEDGQQFFTSFCTPSSSFTSVHSCTWSSFCIYSHIFSPLYIFLLYRYLFYISFLLHFLLLYIFHLLSSTCTSFIFRTPGGSPVSALES